MTEVAVAFENGVLKPDVHMRLVQDIDRIANVAGIPKKMVWSKMDGILTDTEQRWLTKIRHYRDRGSAGLLITGKSKVSPEDKFMLMAGVLLRNFIDARMTVVQDVITRLDNNEKCDSTVLLIPNFFINKAQGGQIPSWKISSLMGLLIKRFSQNNMTVLYVQDMEELKKEYGEPLYNHLKKHYMGL